VYVEMSVQTISLKNIKMDPALRSEILNNIVSGDPSKCVQCGICTSGCPLGYIIKPHRIVKMVNLGLVEQLISSREIWLCTTCFTCSERCPQEVDPANILFTLRNTASKLGYVPRELVEICMNIVKDGRIIKISAGREKEREKLGLPKAPPVDAEKIRKMLEEVGFLKIIGGTVK